MPCRHLIFIFIRRILPPLLPCEFKPMKYEFKSTSYKFKSPSYEFKSTTYEFKYTSNEFKCMSYEYDFTSYEFKSTNWNENSRKQSDELVRFWTYICGLSELLWRDLQSMSSSCIFFKIIFKLASCSNPQKLVLFHGSAKRRI